MSPCSSLLAGQAQLDAIISPMIIKIVLIIFY